MAANARLIFCFWICLAATSQAGTRVAVVDFECAGAHTNGWEWARRGLADLLQLDLARAGVETLDRDQVSAVIAEQRLVGAGVAQKNTVQVGRLLGAQWIVSGLVTPGDDDHFVIEARATSVGEVETVAVATEAGLFPREMNAMVERLARTLSERLGVVIPPAPTKPANAPSPEVWVHFYRGVEACARGWPELALGSFLAAQKLDPSFVPAKAWEFKAYKLTGLNDHAAVAAEELAALPGQMASAAGLVRHDKPVLVVLPSELRVALEAAVLRTGQARLFNAELLSEVAAEFDLRLSGAFLTTEAPAYGRWLAADGMLLCRPSNGNVRLSLHEPLTGNLVGSVTGPRDRLDPLIADLLRRWQNHQLGQAKSGPDFELRELPGLQTIVAETGLRLARLLDRRRQGQDSQETQKQLIWVYIDLRQPRHAQVEKQRMMDRIRGDEPDALSLIYSVYFYPWENEELNERDFGRPPDSWRQRLEAAMAKQPESEVAGRVWYVRGLAAWNHERWSEATNCLSRAEAILSRQTLRPSNASLAAMQAAVHFMIGTSLAELGNDTDAHAHLARANELLIGPGESPVWFPLNPHEELLRGYSNDLRKAIPAALTRLAAANARWRQQSPQMHYGLGYKALNGLLLTNGNPHAVEVAMHLTDCLRAIIHEWQQRPRRAGESTHGCDPGLDIVCQPLLDLGGLERDLHQDFGCRQLATQVAAAYRVWAGLDSTNLPPNELLGMHSRLAQIYSCGGLNDESAQVFESLFEARFPVETALGALQELGHTAVGLRAYEERIARVARRLPRHEHDLPWSVWMLWGSKAQADRQLDKAAGCFHSAFENASELQPRYTAALRQAECLIALDRKEEAAKLLREIVLATGGKTVFLVDDRGSHSFQRLDKAAAQLLAKLRSEGFASDAILTPDNANGH
jgi:tetratricopeptide (TPR) repeat protein